MHFPAKEYNTIAETVKSFEEMQLNALPVQVTARGALYGHGTTAVSFRPRHVPWECPLQVSNAGVLSYNAGSIRKREGHAT